VARPIFACLLALLLALPLAPATAATEPQEVVRETADQMLGKLRSHRTELDADPSLIYGMVQEIVLPRFDFELISRYVLGRYWRQASAAQQQAFIEGFRSLLVRTYAHALLNYSDQDIRYLSVRADKDGDRVLVPTQVAAAGAPAIPIDYKLYRDGGGAWRVYDVVIDGISLVSTYRSNFNSQIGRVGIDGVIESMQQRAEGTTP
jgi:phospholipid transport system substrate-binding protein